METGTSILFIPQFPESYGVWMGPIFGCEDFKKKYEVDQVYYVDQVFIHVNLLRDKMSSSVVCCHCISLPDC